MDDDGFYSNEIVVENTISGGEIPKEFINPALNGAKEGMGSGHLMGYPMVGAKVTLIGGSFHEVDSSELAFEQAADMAVKDAVEKAGPILLEPIMKVQVVVPETYFGTVQGNLISKRGIITDAHVHGQMRILDVCVPLVEMFGYASQIRGATAGRGSFTMEPLNYEKVPEQISEKLLLGY